MTIGEKIRRFREENLLTLRQASELLDVSPAEISRLESNKNKSHFITESKWNKKLEKATKEIKK